MMAEKEKYDLMIDLEAASTNIPKAVVIAIGACLFKIEDGVEISYEQAGSTPQFYKSVSIKSQLKKKRLLDKDTIEWWLNENEKLFGEMIYKGEDPVDVIGPFLEFYHTYDINEIWCCGMDFDFPIIKDLFKDYGYKVPWRYSKQNDTRTIKKWHNYFELKDSMGVVQPGENAHHNALDDCIRQVVEIQVCHKIKQR